MQAGARGKVWDFATLVSPMVAPQEEPGDHQWHWTYLYQIIWKSNNSCIDIAVGIKVVDKMTDLLYYPQCYVASMA